MDLIHSVLSIALAVVCVLAAAGDFTGQPSILEAMSRLGVTRLLPMLVAAKMLGAVGLLVGLVVPQVGVIAAAGLTLYFLAAIVAHLRVRDSWADTAGAAVLAVVSAATLATGLAI
jgi:hypothetical protein